MKCPECGCCFDWELGVLQQNHGVSNRVAEAKSTKEIFEKIVGGLPMSTHPSLRLVQKRIVKIIREAESTHLLDAIFIRDINEPLGKSEDAINNDFVNRYTRVYTNNIKREHELILWQRWLACVRTKDITGAVELSNQLKKYTSLPNLKLVRDICTLVDGIS